MNSRRYVICDIEATGLDEHKEIIEIALITYQDDKVVDVYETLINPLRPISEFIQDLTSISHKELTEAPKFYDVADAIRMRLEGGIFVSHNTEFDLNLLKRKYQEMGQTLNLKNFCTFKVAQHEIPGLKSYNLDALCNFFHIKIRDRHRAIGDAWATLELFKELFQLRTKVYPKILFLPHHEKSLKKIPTKAGLLIFKDAKGKLIRQEAAFNMEKRARELLEVKEENKDLLRKAEVVEGEVTGSALIAEFKKLLYYPYKPHWVIYTQTFDSGEKHFKIRPYKKGIDALWYYKDYFDAKKKLQELNLKLKDDKFIYRDGPRSKEEILKHNHKLELLSREAKFPNDNLVLVGEGRTLHEKSLILVRRGHVLGFGYTEASEEEIFAVPESFITTRFFQHLAINLATQRYLKILKNLRQKNEGWRSLSEVR